MAWRKKQLENSNLYVILDTGVLKKNLLTITKKISNTKVDIVQLRNNIYNDKEFLRLAFVCKKIITNKKKLFIINNRPDIVKLVGAHGLHLGQDDLPINNARSIVGENCLIGISCHSLKQIKTAQRQGVDYISFGPVFKTKIKPEYKPFDFNLIKNIVSITKLPYFAIGGINLNNLKKLKKIGIKKVAVLRAISCAKDIANIVKSFKEILNSPEGVLHNL